MIRVCLIEDQTLVREGLVSLLELIEDIEVVGTATSGQEAIEMLPHVKPDVALLDIRMPNGSGLDVLRDLAKTENPVPVIVLTTFDEDDVFLEACRLGAKGYLLKDVSLQALTSAIRAVVQGSTLFSPSITTRLLKALQGSTQKNDTRSQESLTDREIETLRLMTGGYSNAEIAFALRIAEGTVKNHVSSILSKLNVRDRVRAVLRGIELGYIHNQ
jgi:DNA-binding NarL/FixJ family response regulator